MDMRKTADRQKEFPVKGTDFIFESAEIRCAETRQPHQNTARAVKMQCGPVQIFKPAAEGDSPRTDFGLNLVERLFLEFV